MVISMNSIVRLSSLISIFALITGCSVMEQLSPVDAMPTPIPPAKLYNASTVTGAWSPSVVGTGTVNQKGSVTTDSKIIFYKEAGMVRFQDAWNGKEVTVDLGEFLADRDFGYDSSGNGNGSLTLTADVINYPYSAGGAYPVLSSLYVVGASGSVVAEYVNVTSGCINSGMWVCSSGSCSANSNCSVQSNSSFFSREDWDQHQAPPFGYESINSFPRCDASLGGQGWSGCPAALKTLPSGHYYAKYVLMSDRNVAVTTATADLRVRLTTKKDTVARNDPTSNGAININVVLVGSGNINDSHTPKGAQNLNLLFQEVNQILKNAANISIGDIKVYEWRDEDGGDYYSQVDYSLVGEMFMSGSQGVPLEEESNSINVFMVRDIQYSGAKFTILGLAGGILGPPVNASYASGLAFSTNVASGGLISSFNLSTGCTLSSCPREKQDDDFLEMGATIAHELGHYLGLNHPSEKVSTMTETQQHDQMTDTPTCAPQSTFAGPVLSHSSCYLDSKLQFTVRRCSVACDSEIQGSNPSVGSSNAVYFKSNNKTDYYCPATTECQFNHVMWYTVKNRKLVSGQWREDGNLISTQSSALVQWSPFVK